MNITQSYLKSVLDFDTETGIFKWRIKRPGKSAGDQAGCLNTQGYTVIKINDYQYKAHRLAWLYVNGSWPNSMIDHINGNRNDNRICNLREATATINGSNRVDGNSFPGVGFHTRVGKWFANCWDGGKRKHLGYFNTHIAACYARWQWQINRCED